MFRYILRHTLALTAMFLTPVFVSFLLIYGLWELCGLSGDSEHATKAFFAFVCGFCIFAPCAVCAMLAGYMYFDWAFGSEAPSIKFKKQKEASDASK